MRYLRGNVKGVSTGQNMASFIFTSEGLLYCPVCSDCNPEWGTGIIAFGARGTLVLVVKKVVSLIGNCSLFTDVFGRGL